MTRPGRRPHSQRADDVETLCTVGAGTVDTEVVVHVRGDGCTLDDGTPISDSAVARLLHGSFVSALVHDSSGEPIDATNRSRHPTRRQRRLVDERDLSCADCGRTDLLHYDHVPPYEQTGHAITGELRRRCSHCRVKRHRPGVPPG